MSDAPKLMPCPMCGGEAEGLSCLDEYWVECKACGVSSRLRASQGAAMADWNRRAPVRVKLPDEGRLLMSRLDVVAALKAQGVEVYDG